MRKIAWRNPFHKRGKKSPHLNRREWWETAAEFSTGDEGFDILGSYTGTPYDDDLMPEQDADDL
ncbi:MAG: hypothetical protein FWH26_10300 [Oscillospiraceae bacterium]|nr:hypothetical protein [Oscillospiraceae bacterium]